MYISGRSRCPSTIGEHKARGRFVITVGLGIYGQTTGISEMLFATPALVYSNKLFEPTVVYISKKWSGNYVDYPYTSGAQGSVAPRSMNAPSLDYHEWYRWRQITPEWERTDSRGQIPYMEISKDTRGGIKE